jgi:glycine cleavage system H protein
VTTEHPDDLQYTREHEWLRKTDNAVRVGITAYAQEALGDIVFVTLPAVGTEVRAGEPLGEVESTKSVSDIYAPVSGTVTARNEQLDARPELVNSDPYGEGWMVEIEQTAGGDADGGPRAEVLDAAGYRDLVASL